MKYISAPYTFLSNKEETMNKVTTYSAKCLANGEYVICPLTMGHAFSLKDPELDKNDRSFWMNWCYELLKCCDEMDVLCLEGWEESLGVQDEIRFAEENNIKINYIFLK